MGQGACSQVCTTKTIKFRLFCMDLQMHGQHTFSTKESPSHMVKRPIWNKWSHFSVLSLAALLWQPTGQIWLASPKGSNNRRLAHTAQSGQTPTALLVLLSPGQKAVAFHNTLAAFFLLGNHSWAAGLSYQISTRDTVNSRSITTLRYNNPTSLEM